MYCAIVLKHSTGLVVKRMQLNQCCMHNVLQKVISMSARIDSRLKQMQDERRMKI